MGVLRVTRVVKIGSRVLTTADGQLDLNQMRQLVSDIMAAQKFDGSPVVLVSSGAIICGSGVLNSPVNTLPEKQAAA
ncbi:MAG: glutamate 5-kinase, partial [Candidatus Marinamargulisbacteria bacterium]|nr:glutamate 5-kinase [Candidatus Marinamargulisbacteria bacterium]